MVFKKFFSYSQKKLTDLIQVISTCVYMKSIAPKNSIKQTHLG